MRGYEDAAHVVRHIPIGERLAVQEVVGQFVAPPTLGLTDRAADRVELDQPRQRVGIVIV